MKKYLVSTSNPYEIILGKDLIDNAGSYICERLPDSRFCIVTDSNVSPLYADRIMDSLNSHGKYSFNIVFPAGEHSKSINTFSNIVEALAEEGFTRSDAIISLGGGTVGDVAGFASATYLRGIPYVQIPTTYQSTIDSSVGGKASVNLLSGKNLIGSFWQPALVLCDYTTFHTLSEECLLDGKAEAVKNAVVAENKLIDHIFTNDYEYVIDRCISIKKSIVEADERETSLRQLLNFGHTVGHGIEKLSAFSITHGQAVAKGMVMESRGAYKMGLTDTDISKELSEILTEMGFDLTVNFEPEDLYKCALTDKKIYGDKISLVIPESIGKCRLQKLPLSQLKDYFNAAVK